MFRNTSLGVSAQDFPMWILRAERWADQQHWFSKQASIAVKAAKASFVGKASAKKFGAAAQAVSC